MVKFELQIIENRYVLQVYEHNLELKKLQRYLSKETQDLKNLENELKYLQDNSTNDKMR